MPLIYRARSVALVCMFAISAEFAHADTTRAFSPDGKFYSETTEPDGDNPFGLTRIVLKKTGDAVWESPEETRNSFTADQRCVWSPDATSFALNYRAGGRYETTAVFRWNGKTFAPLPSIEEAFSAPLTNAKENRLIALARTFPDYPANLPRLRRSQRRIWDNFTVRHWIDGKTLQATGYSICYVTCDLGKNEGEDIHGALRLVLRKDKHKHWTIIGEETIPLEQAETPQP